jgi:hypothetical protein
LSRFSINSGERVSCPPMVGLVCAIVKSGRLRGCVSSWGGASVSHSDFRRFRPGPSHDEGECEQVRQEHPASDLGSITPRATGTGPSDSRLMYGIGGRRSYTVVGGLWGKRGAGGRGSGRGAPLEATWRQDDRWRSRISAAIVPTSESPGTLA